MVILLLSILSLSASNNIHCISSPCIGCTGSEKVYNSKSCFPTCPTGFLASSQSCILSPSGSTSLISVKFNQMLDFTAKSISIFSTPNGEAFNYPLRETPIPTKERGFYFDSNSGLIASPLSYQLASDLTLRILIRVTGCTYSNCNIFSVLDNSSGNYLFQLSVSSTSLTSTWRLVSTSNQAESDQLLSTSFGYFSWSKLIVTLSQSTEVLTIYHLLNNYGTGDGSISYSPFEFRHDLTVNTLTVTLGGAGQSFQGFLYDLNLENAHITSYDISAYLVECEYNQYYSHPQCKDCDPSCPTWPWCVRGGACSSLNQNICFSSACGSCTGFSQNLCSTTSVQCFRFCLTCSGNTAYQCLACPSHLVLINGICIYKPYNWDPNNLNIPTVSLKFNIFEQYYDGLFQSGHNPATYAPYHYPDYDDPIPLLGRGLYFNISMTLKSISSISMYYQNTFLIWAWPMGGGFNFWNAPSILLFGDGHSSILLTDSETWTRYDSLLKNSAITGWTFYAFVHDFNNNIFSSNVYLNGQVFSSYTKPGYLLYDIRTNVYILGEGFLYSINAYNFAFSNFYQLFADDICGPGLFASCLSNCQPNEYLSGSTCTSCDSNCQFGCVKGGSCNLCKISNCLTCESFDSTSCLSYNKSACAPAWPEYKDYNNCCTSACASCDGPFDFSCTSCYPGFYLVGSVCMNTCPLGYTTSGQNCVLSDSLIFFYIFDTIYDVYKNPNYPVSFSTGQDSSYYPDNTVSDPIPAVSRGLYFSKTSYMTSNNFTFASSFTVIMWIKYYVFGKVFSKNALNYEVSSQTDIQVTNGISFSCALPLYQVWSSLFLKVWTGADYRINAMTGTVKQKTCTFTGSIDYFIDSQSSFVIGDYSTSFVGFIYEVLIYNSVFDPASLSEYHVCTPLVNSNCLWDCDINHYWDQLTCQPCKSTCLSGCKDLQHCNICYDEKCYHCHDYVTPCDICKNHAYFRSEICYCNGGYYWDNYSETCQPCNENCQLCSGPGSDHCLSCIDENCVKCKSEFSESCVECVADYEAAANGVCVKCTKEQFYDITEKKCVKCPAPCLECSGPKSCEKCMENASFFKDWCKCDQGFVLNVTCQETYFSVQYSISNKNVITAHFEQPLLADLVPSDLAVSVTNNSVQVSVKKKSDLEYDIHLSLSSPPDPSSRVNLDISSKIYSLNKALFVNRHYTALLFVQDSPGNLGIVDVQTVLTSIFFTGIGLVATNSLLGQNLSSFFFFLQALELYVYVLMYLVEISEELSNVLQLLNTGSWLPNVFGYLVPESFGVQLSGKLNVYGFNSNIFLVNSGVSLFTFCIFLLLLPVFYGLTKTPVKLIKDYSEKRVKDYNYRLFCRFYIQMFLEFCITSYISVYFNLFQNYVQIFDFSVSVITQLCLISGLVIFIKITYRKLKNPTDPDLEKWGTFFDEIRDSKPCQYFYVFYFIRRVAIACCIILVPSDLMQLVISSVFSFAISLYIWARVPFEKPQLNFYLICSELILFSFYLNLMVGILSNGSIGVFTVGSAGIKIVITALVFNICYSLYETYLMIRQKLKKNIRPILPAPHSMYNHANVTSIVDPDLLFRDPSESKAREFEMKNS